MRNLIRIFVLGAAVGGVVGWLLRDAQERRQAQAANEAYANDPEVIALRNEFTLLRAMDDALGSTFEGMEE